MVGRPAGEVTVKFRLPGQKTFQIVGSLHGYTTSNKTTFTFPLPNSNVESAKEKVKK